jgi:hypothetical protein
MLTTEKIVKQRITFAIETATVTCQRVEIKVFKDLFTIESKSQIIKPMALKNKPVQ